MTNLPNPPRLNQKGLGLPLILSAVLLLLIGVGGGYYLMNVVNKPAQIKQAVEPTQEPFNNYARSIEDLAADFDDSGSGSDADSLERSVQKTKGLLTTAEDNRKILEPLVDKINFSETSALKSELQEYLDKSKKLIDIQAENVRVGEKIIAPIRKYQDLSVELAGVANYMFSDPTRYTQTVSEFIAEDEKLIQEMEAIDAKDGPKEVVDILVKKMKSEKVFLEEIVEAVRTRDSAAIASAEKVYTQEAVEIEKELNRITDKQKEEVKNLSRDLEDLADKVKASFSNMNFK